MAPTASDAAYTHGYWLVAFIDLLGQQEAFMRTDRLPDESDPLRKQAFMEDVQASIGVVRQMRSFLDTFQAALGNTSISDGSPLQGLPPQQLAIAERMRSRRVRDDRWSDGVVLSCPLKPGPGHAFPIVAVHDVVCTCAALMLVHLAMGRPIRGGLDVGIATEFDGELFGAALVKAYRLESKRAQHPRLVVGKGLVEYLNAAVQAPIIDLDSQYARDTANLCHGLLEKDDDGESMVDYAGAKALEVFSGTSAGTRDMFVRARTFAKRSRSEYQRRGDEEGKKLFARYSKVVRYLDTRARLWGDTT